MLKVSFTLTVKNRRQDHSSGIHDDVTDELLDNFGFAEVSKEMFLVEKDERMRTVYIPAYKYTTRVKDDKELLKAQAIALQYSKRLEMSRAIFEDYEGKIHTQTL